MKACHLPGLIYELFIKRMKDQHCHINYNTDVMALDWGDTPEGTEFWKRINNAEYETYDKVYPDGHEDNKPKPGDRVHFKVRSNSIWVKIKAFLLCYDLNGNPWVAIEDDAKDRARRVFDVRKVPEKKKVTQDELLTAYCALNNISKDQIQLI